MQILEYNAGAIKKVILPKLGADACATAQEFKKGDNVGDDIEWEQHAVYFNQLETAIPALHKTASRQQIFVMRI